MMKYERFKISKHAAMRMSQRNLDLGDLALVLHFGRVEHRTGAEFHFLGRRDVPDGWTDLERLVGTTIVVSGGEIITVYRNRRALPEIRRKSKHYRSAFASPFADCALPSFGESELHREAKGGRIWH
ncbi:MAG: DUF4258 domain-containing protein [Acidobacteria bacterium]|nr:DUF4258 domain-containing protein [Acidobacteriota bacterium]MCW5971339.1 DUF4258 domain-containing protein [Blastocatellales bacterium]